jgi:hypothetical protein
MSKGGCLTEWFFDKTCPEPNSGCVLWTAYRTRLGYGHFAVNRRTRLAHHVAWWIAFGRWPTFLMHRCDTPACVNVEHLREGTNADNVADMMAKGRYGTEVRAKNKPRGERHVNAKLTEAMVLSIRADTGTQRDLAARYGVGQVTINYIRLNKAWAHVGRSS